MFELGWAELLLIAVVALVVIGPKELPTVMHRLGQTMAWVRQQGQHWWQQLEQMGQEPPAASPPPPAAPSKNTTPPSPPPHAE